MTIRQQNQQAHQELFNTILDEIPEFQNAIKTDGAYIRSSIADNGFEFVVGIKPDEKILFEYIARTNPSPEDHRHATFIRDYLGMGGGNTANYAKVAFNCDKALKVGDIDEVIESLKGFIHNTTVTVTADKMLQMALV